MDDENRPLLRLMTYMMCADGRIEDAEVTTIKALYEELTGLPLAEERIGDEVIAVADDHAALVTLLGEACETQSEEERERLLEAAMKVAAADGEIAPDELAALSSVAQALEIDRGRFNAILGVVESHA